MCQKSIIADSTAKHRTAEMTWGETAAKPAEF
jgi:hypothetical protein